MQQKHNSFFGLIENLVGHGAELGFSNVHADFKPEYVSSYGIPIHIFASVWAHWAKLSFS